MLVSFSRNRPLEPSIPVAAICEESQEIELNEEQRLRWEALLQFGILLGTKTHPVQRLLQWIRCFGPSPYLEDIYLIGGGARFVIADYPFSDVDLAIFDAKNPDDMYKNLINIMVGFIDRFDPQSQQAFHYFFRRNDAHLYLSVGRVDLKVPRCENRSHLFNHDAAVMKLSWDKESFKEKVSIVAVPRAIVTVQEALDHLFKKRLRLSDPDNAFNYHFRVLKYFTENFEVDPELMGRAIERLRDNLEEEPLKLFCKNHLIDDAGAKIFHLNLGNIRGKDWAYKALLKLLLEQGDFSLNFQIYWPKSLDDCLLDLFEPMGKNVSCYMKRLPPHLHAKAFQFLKENYGADGHVLFQVNKIELRVHNPLAYCLENPRNLVVLSETLPSILARSDSTLEMVKQIFAPFKPEEACKEKRHILRHFLLGFQKKDGFSQLISQFKDLFKENAYDEAHALFPETFMNKASEYIIQPGHPIEEKLELLKWIKTTGISGELTPGAYHRIALFYLETPRNDFLEKFVYAKNPHNLTNWLEYVATHYPAEFIDYLYTLLEIDHSERVIEYICRFNSLIEKEDFDKIPERYRGFFGKIIERRFFALLKEDREKAKELLCFFDLGKTMKERILWIERKAPVGGRSRILEVCLEGVPAPKSEQELIALKNKLPLKFYKNLIEQRAKATSYRGGLALQLEYVTLFPEWWKKELRPLPLNTCFDLLPKAPVETLGCLMDILAHYGVKDAVMALKIFENCETIAECDSCVTEALQKVIDAHSGLQIHPSRAQILEKKFNVNIRGLKTIFPASDALIKLRAAGRELFKKDMGEFRRLLHAICSSPDLDFTKNLLQYSRDSSIIGDRGIVKNILTFVLLSEAWGPKIEPIWIGCLMDHLDRDLENIASFVDDERLRSYFIENLRKISKPYLKVALADQILLCARVIPAQGAWIKNVFSLLEQKNSIKEKAFEAFICWLESTESEQGQLAKAYSIATSRALKTDYDLSEFLPDRIESFLEHGEPHSLTALEQLDMVTFVDQHRKRVPQDVLENIVLKIDLTKLSLIHLSCLTKQIVEMNLQTELYQSVMPELLRGVLFKKELFQEARSIIEWMLRQTNFKVEHLEPLMQNLVEKESIHPELVEPLVELLEKYQSALFFPGTNKWADFAYLSVISKQVAQTNSVEKICTILPVYHKPLEEILSKDLERITIGVINKICISKKLLNFMLINEYLDVFYQILKQKETFESYCLESLIDLQNPRPTSIQNFRRLNHLERVHLMMLRLTCYLNVHTKQKECDFKKMGEELKLFLEECLAIYAKEKSQEIKETISDLILIILNEYKKLVLQFDFKGNYPVALINRVIEEILEKHKKISEDLYLSLIHVVFLTSVPDTDLIREERELYELFFKRGLKRISRDDVLLEVAIDTFLKCYHEAVKRESLFFVYQFVDLFSGICPVNSTELSLEWIDSRKAAVRSLGDRIKKSYFNLIFAMLNQGYLHYFRMGNTLLQQYKALYPEENVSRIEQRVRDEVGFYTVTEKNFSEKFHLIVEKINKTTSLKDRFGLYQTLTGLCSMILRSPATENRSNFVKTLDRLCEDGLCAILLNTDEDLLEAPSEEVLFFLEHTYPQLIHTTTMLIETSLVQKGGYSEEILTKYTFFLSRRIREMFEFLYLQKKIEPKYIFAPAVDVLGRSILVQAMHLKTVEGKLQLEHQMTSVASFFTRVFRPILSELPVCEEIKAGYQFYLGQLHQFYKKIHDRQKKESLQEKEFILQRILELVLATNDLNQAKIIFANKDEFQFFITKIANAIKGNTGLNLRNKILTMNTFSPWVIERLNILYEGDPRQSFFENIFEDFKREFNA